MDGPAGHRHSSGADRCDQCRPDPEELLLVINQGAAALIADMTATVSCDHAGADAVVRAYRRAVVNGIQLRLVVTAQIVRRVLSINGLDRLIPIYPCLEAAVAARAPAPVIPVAPGQLAHGTGLGARPSPRRCWGS